MPNDRAGVLRSWWWPLAVCAAFCSPAVWRSPVQAQIGLGFQQAVGGVYVDGRGVVNNVARDQFNKLRETKLRQMQKVDGELAESAELRKVSLRQMQAAIAEANAAGKDIPDEVRYLAGIQRIQYVFVYPDKNDIVLAGSGEGWQVDERGNMVGKTTGRPVIEFDDLLVALRTAESAAQGGIACSIDPTQEGLQRVRAYMTTPSPTKADPESFARGMEKELGPQKVTIRGVPTNSHFAAVLLAADYRMKRIAMAFERSPVRGLTSFLQMLKQGGDGPQNVFPRWWLATDYEPLLTDEEGLAWELRGQGVKAMTEDEFVAAGGQRAATGKANPKAQQWAKTMTEKYDALSAKEADFRRTTQLHGSGGDRRLDRQGKPGRQGRLRFVAAVGPGASAVAAPVANSPPASDLGQLHRIAAPVRVQRFGRRGGQFVGRRRQKGTKCRLIGRAFEGR